MKKATISFSVILLLALVFLARPASASSTQDDGFDGVVYVFDATSEYVLHEWYWYRAGIPGAIINFYADEVLLETVETNEYGYYTFDFDTHKLGTVYQVRLVDVPGFYFCTEPVTIITMQDDWEMWTFDHEWLLYPTLGGATPLPADSGTEEDEEARPALVNIEISDLSSVIWRVPDSRVYLLDEQSELVAVRYFDDFAVMSFMRGLHGCTSAPPVFTVRVVADGSEPIYFYNLEFRLFNGETPVWATEIFIEPSHLQASEPIPAPQNGIYINGTRLTLDVPPTMINNRMLVPIRQIGEALGAEFAWDPTTRTATMTLGETTVIMEIDNSEARVIIDGVETTHTLDSPPVLQGGRTLVPLRFIGEIFGADVDWQPPNAIITTP